MARRGDVGAKRRALETPEHADSVSAWMLRYLEHQQTLGVSAHSWSRMRDDLVRFHDWCGQRLIGSPAEITRPMLERYQRFLFHYRKADGHPLSGSSQVRELSRIKHWFRWLVRRNVLTGNPASDIELPRVPRRVLPQVFSVSEIERVLAQASTDTALGIRDRTMMEVLYATGMRRMELAGLSLFDVNAMRQVVHIRQGKGRKDRVVPISERALAWVEKYREEVRPLWVTGASGQYLFLSMQGEPVQVEYVGIRMRGYVRAAGLGKTGACHVFRHAVATAMLENGADIRFIQALLGHAGIGTTEIYTHVSIEALKAIHRATHPGARRESRLKPESEEGPDAEAS